MHAVAVQESPGRAFRFVMSGPSNEDGHKYDLYTDIPTAIVDGNTLNPRNIFKTLRSPATEVGLKSTGIFRPLHITCQEYLVRRAAFYRSLQPVDAVARVVDEFYHRYLRLKLVVGVHVRVDRKHDYPVVPGALPKPWSVGTPIAAIEAVR